MKHVTDTEIQLYHLHQMEPDQERGLLGHIAECEYCAGRWASCFPAQEMLTPPNGLREQIRREAGKSKAAGACYPAENGQQAEDKPQYRKMQYREWYWYSAKIVLAMGLAIMMLFVGDFRQMFHEETDRSILQQSQEYHAENSVSSQIRQRTEKFGGAIKDLPEYIGRSLRGEDGG